MKKVFTIIILVLCSFQSLKITAQIDTVFWFAAPWTTPDHTWRDPIKLHITGEQGTLVRVRQPAAIAPNQYDTTFFIPAGGLFDYTFWRDAGASPTNRAFDSLEARPANTVLPYGLKISSAFNITVVYDQITRAPSFYNPETFSLKGQNALGTNFICPQQNTWPNQTMGSDLNGDAIVTQPRQQINIVATLPNTIVWIRPKCAIVGHAAGSTYSVMMNTGDVYTLENLTANTSTANPGQNLGGTLITSNNPIAVTIADDSVKNAGGGCFDFIGDQIVPVENVGSEYIANKGFMYAASGESVFIMGTDTLTQVIVDDGVASLYNLNKGAIKQYALTQPLTHITSNKNVYVLQTSGFGCESGEALLPPVNCAGSDSVIFSRNNNQSFSLNIITRTADIGSFLLNGTATLVPASSFSIVPGTSGLWSGAQIQYNITQIPVNSANTIKNLTGPFTLGIINGGVTTGGLFHYMSEFPKRIYVSSGSTQTICSTFGSTLNLSGTISGGSNTGSWTTTNGTGAFGTYSSTFNNITTTYSLSMADLFLPQIKFILNAFGGCMPASDTLVVTNYPLPVVTLGASQSTVCVGAGAITLTGTPPGGTYSGTFVSGNMFTPSATGNYSPNYTYTDPNGCINNDTVGIFVASCLGIANQNTKTTLIKAFPNPVKNFIEFSNPNNEHAKVTLYDVTGKVIVNTFSFDQNHYILNVEKINSGLYNLKIESETNQQYIKIIKL